jgi:hypothetical protein
MGVALGGYRWASLDPETVTYAGLVIETKPAGTEMNSQFPDELRKRITAFLTHQRTCIISTTASQGVSAMPVWYRSLPGTSGSPGLEVDCLVPRWSDVAHHLTQEPRVVLIVQGSSAAGLRWLQIQGTTQPVEAPDWTRLLPRWVTSVQPGGLYLVVRVTPHRIDLIDEDLGWGVQDTLEW